MKRSTNWAPFTSASPSRADISVRNCLFLSVSHSSVEEIRPHKVAAWSGGRRPPSLLSRALGLLPQIAPPSRNRLPLSRLKPTLGPHLPFAPSHLLSVASPASCSSQLYRFSPSVLIGKLGLTSQRLVYRGPILGHRQDLDSFSPPSIFACGFCAGSFLAYF